MTISRTASSPLHLPSPDALAAFAARLAESLQPGDVIALDGPLGAGKTTLVQTLAQALGVTERVNSPSFVLLNEYHTGRFPVAHADLYRLGETGAERLAGELNRLFDQGDTLVLIEWASLGAALDLPITHQITLAYGNAPDSRTLTLTPAGDALNDAAGDISGGIL